MNWNHGRANLRCTETFCPWQSQHKQNLWQGTTLAKSRTPENLPDCLPRTWIQLSLQLYKDSAPEKKPRGTHQDPCSSCQPCSSPMTRQYFSENKRLYQGTDSSIRHTVKRRKCSDWHSFMFPLPRIRESALHLPQLIFLILHKKYNTTAQ